MTNECHPQPERHPESSRGWSRIRLFARSLRLAWLAQAVRKGVPLGTVSARLLALPTLAETPDIGAVARATRWSCRLLGEFFGLLDSCLIRSLVAATLLADRGAVQVRLGFRLGDGDDNPLAGHAWVTVDGAVVPQGEDGHDDHEYVEAFDVTFDRHG